MQEAEVARATEPFGQDMLQDQPQELRSRNCPRLGALGLGILVAEGHLPVLAREDILFPDYAAVQIAPEIDQRLFPGADAFSIDDPFFGVARRQGKPFGGDGIEQLGAKDLGQGLVIEQIAALTLGSLRPPQPVLRIDGRGGNHQVHMWVVTEPA